MNERNYAIDFIRLFAILGVVVIHVSTAFIDRAVPFSVNFYIYNLINQLTRFSVPLFFLISGFLLASKYDNITSPINFYKRRLDKILIPYFFWSLFYYLFIFKNPVSHLFTKGFLNNLYTGDTSYQLYFIPAIIVLYLLFPFIIYFKKYLLTKWFIVLLLIFTAVLLTNTYYQNINIPIDTPFRLAFYNLLPFLVGIYAAIRIKNLNIFIKNMIIPFIISAFIFGFTVFGESTYMFSKTHIDDYLRNQWRISVLLYGISLAPILYYFYPTLLRKYEKTIYYFSGFALGVFFVHVAILNFLLEVIDNYKLYSFPYFILTLIIITTLSFVFSIALSRIKFLNRILGLRG
ncbi:MAG TPA: acyltransferase [Patescibacteria group bacterium]|nr:acyltransferase [Patescibacteria group bacterium]